jgi:hypothetical protein
VLFACAGFFFQASGAQPLQLLNTPNGLSGYLFAPSARIAPSGTVSFDYAPSVPGADRLDGHNASVLFALRPELELAGRVAANTLQCNSYAEANCGMRDLSASGKFGFSLRRLTNREPFSNVWVAAGATDVGGAATSFRSRFAVATYDASRWEASVGVAKAEPGLSVHMPLDGVFAAAAWQLRPWLRLQAELTSSYSYIGAMLSEERVLPALGFPSGSRLHVQLNMQLEGMRETPRPYLSFGFRIPMDGTLTPAGAVSDSLRELTGLRSTPRLGDPGRSDPRTFDPGSASELAAVLFEQGFSDIFVGDKHDGETLVVSVNNMAYSHSELDALGVALGHLAHARFSMAERYQLVLMRWNVPIALVEGDRACLRSWLGGAGLQPCHEENALRLRLNDFAGRVGRGLDPLLGKVRWSVEGAHPAWQKLRLHLGPQAHYTFATEYGIWDHTLGLAMVPWLHLWPGAILEGFRVAHVQSMRDYEGGIFSFWRVRSGNGRIMLHQAFHAPWQPPRSFGGQISGRIDLGQPLPDWLGGGGELRWDSESGRHAVTLSRHRYLYQGAFTGFGPGEPRFGAYRYLVPGTDWQLEASYGRWWNQDRSLSLASRHWFGDLNLGFVIHSFEDARPLWFGGTRVSFAAIELSLPLTLRREVHTGNWPIDVRGLPRYALGLATTVGRTDNAFVGSGGFPLYAHLGVGPGVPFSTGAILRDFDRLNMAYVPFHVNRIRYAFERWVQPFLPESSTAAQPSRAKP